MQSLKYSQNCGLGNKYAFMRQVTKFSAPVTATGLGSALEGLEEYQRATEVEQSMGSRYEYFQTYDDKENQCRNKVLNGLSHGFFGYSKIGLPIEITCDRIAIDDLYGLTVRARNLEDQLSIKIQDNKIMFNGQVVCSDTKKKDDKASYQKSADGTYWYTNLKVGEPMKQAEIDEFEEVWAEDETALEDIRRRERIRRQRQERVRERQAKEEEKRIERKRVEDKQRLRKLAELRKEHEEELVRLRKMAVDVPKPYAPPHVPRKSEKKIPEEAFVKVFE